MTKSNVWHHYLLTITALGVSLVAIYSVINPKVGNHQVKDFLFPQKVPLASWNSIDNQKNKQKIQIDPTAIEDNNQKIQAGNRYQYQDGDTKLDIEMFYLTDTRGDIEKLLEDWGQIDPQVLENKKIAQKYNGYYSLFSDRDRAYLSTCLNSNGMSTVTPKQFSQSLNNRRLNPKLIMNWLLGKDSIRDRRCLWITISIPHNKTSLAKSQATLEQVWQHWQQWWQPRFPSL